MKVYKAYKFHIGQAVMKANPKKLGGRKGDRMTPDWLDGFVVVGLTDHQVVLRNTKTNKVLKSISLAHIKPFRERGADNKFAVEVADVGEEVADVGEEVADVGEEVADVGEEVAGGGKEVAGGGEEIAGGGEGVTGGGEEVTGGGEEVTGVEVAYVGEEVAGVDASSSFAGEVQHLQQLVIKGIPLCFPYLDFGPAKLTGRDIWSLIPPQEVSTCQFNQIKNEVPDFMPGWLTDMVRKSFSPTSNIGKKA